MNCGGEDWEVREMALDAKGFGCVALTPSKEVKLTATFEAATIY